MIHVAVSGFEAHADVYYAQDLGLFKRAGLNVDIQQLQGGESIVAAIVAGRAANRRRKLLPLANAHEHGLDVVLFAPASFRTRACGLSADCSSPRTRRL